MGTRDDFPAAVKTALAERVAYRCSFPDCPNPTIGPSQESEMARSRVGIACHISAAAPGPGARRYDPKMTPAERKSFSNGIWMCATHGKLIDTDETLFSVKLLRQWKGAAERKASEDLKRSGTKSQNLSIRMFEHALALTQLGDENRIIGETLNACGVTKTWGPKIAASVRDLCIEVSRNAFRHGKASKVDIEVSGTAVRVCDDGRPFDPLSLANNPNRKGGTSVIKHLLKDLGLPILLTSQSTKTGNELIIARIELAAEIPALTPCALSLDWLTIGAKDLKLQAFESCNLLYLILPDHSSASDAFLIAQTIRRYRSDHSVVFVLQNPSDPAIEGIAHFMPKARVIRM